MSSEPKSSQDDLAPHPLAHDPLDAPGAIETP